MHFSEAEKVFMEDIREKKKAASGVHSKTGKRGYVGKMLFSYDMMSRKEKYNHRKGGKILTTNLFDQIQTIDEFNQLETHEKKNRMQYWRNNNTIKEIQESMGISNKRFYDLITDLDLPKDRSAKRPKQRRKALTKIVSDKQDAQLNFQALETALEPMPAAPPIQEIMVDGLHVIFNGTYSAEKIEKQLTKFMLLLEGEEDEFYIELKLVQKQPKEKEGIL